MLAGFGPVRVSRHGITRKRKSQADARSGVGRSYSGDDALGNQRGVKGTVPCSVAWRRDRRYGGGDGISVTSSFRAAPRCRARRTGLWLGKEGAWGRIAIRRKLAR